MTALTASAQTAPTPPPTPSADLAVFNTATNPNQGRYDFVITVVNNGPSAAPAGQVVLTDGLPAGGGLTFQKVVYNSKKTFCTSPPPGGTGLVSCTNTNSLAPGAGFSVTVVVNVTGLSGTEITNTANVFSSIDPNSTNNSASDTITVK